MINTLNNNTNNINPGVFSSITEAKASKTTRSQTNPRYKRFNQTIFTAGDEDQFREYAAVRNESKNDKRVQRSNQNIHSSFIDTYDLYKKYENIYDTTMIDTYRYISCKFKKGIFVRIINNKLNVFLPFSKNDFANDWSHNIQFVNNQSTKRVNIHVEQWYANNYLVRNEFPINENDTNIPIIKNMFEELCNHRIIPDIEFFINKRDFPILSRGGFEPYSNIWNSDTTPLVSHNYDKYMPIMSMSTSDSHADIAIPNYNDWDLIKQQENIWFSDSSYRSIETINTDWAGKKEIAVFRGTNTGEGITADTNPRLKAAQLSVGMTHILDAGITKWNTRPRKLKGSKILKSIDIKSLGFGLVNSLTPSEQSQYKYILHIPGHVNAFRLSYELSMNSVILMVEHPWKHWYSHLLVPYTHYIPVKPDLSDVFEIIEWCRNNDSQCEVIATNAFNLYKRVINKESIFDYLQTLCDKIKHVSNQKIQYQNPLDVLRVLQKNRLSKLSRLYPKISKLVPIDTAVMTNTTMTELKYFKRFPISMLNGIRYYFNYAVDNGYRIPEEFGNNIGMIKGCPCKLKYTENKREYNEHINETFIGIEIANKLCKYSPNFLFTFGAEITNDSICIIKEYIPGITMYEYLKKDNFNIYDLPNILKQIFYSLHIAQTKYGFCHNDLTPWNIIIQEHNEPRNHVYEISGETIQVLSNITPIIIDFGKSRGVCNNMVFTYIADDLKLSTCKDMIVLCITIAKTLLSKQMKHEEMTFITYLINFFTNSKYIPKPVVSLKQLKTAIKYKSKFDNLTYGNKFEIELKTPLDIIAYLQNYKHLPHKRYMGYYLSTDREYLDRLGYSRPVKQKPINKPVISCCGVYHFYTLISDELYDTYPSMNDIKNIVDTCSNSWYNYTILNEWKILLESKSIDVDNIKCKLRIMKPLLKAPIIPPITHDNIIQYRDEYIIRCDFTLPNIDTKLLNEIEAYIHLNEDHEISSIINNYNIMNTIYMINTHIHLLTYPSIHRP